MPSDLARLRAQNQRAFKALLALGGVAPEPAPEAPQEPREPVITVHRTKLVHVVNRAAPLAVYEVRADGKRVGQIQSFFPTTSTMQLGHKVEWRFWLDGREQYPEDTWSKAEAVRLIAQELKKRGGS